MALPQWQPECDPITVLFTEMKSTSIEYIHGVSCQENVTFLFQNFLVSKLFHLAKAQTILFTCSENPTSLVIPSSLAEAAALRAGAN